MSGEMPFENRYPKEVTRQLKQAERMSLSSQVDFEITTYTSRETGKQFPVVVLTQEGRQKRELLRSEYFGPEVPRHTVPLPKNYEISEISIGDLLEMDGLLALSLIRRRTGGYVCTLTDNFSRLREEKYLARIQQLNEEQKTARLLFDRWPGEFITHEYVVEKDNLVSVNEPISIGPECVINQKILVDGKPREDWIGWAKNAIRRNIVGK